MAVGASQLIPAALRGDPGGALLAGIAAAALAAADPAAAVRRHVSGRGPALVIAGVERRLPAGGRWLAVGAGKAGAAMAEALAEIAGELIAEGLVIVKDGHGGAQGVPGRIGPIELTEAGHPFPDERGVAAAERIAGLLAGAGERDGIIALLSGGGSALLTLPAPGLALADLQRATELLMHAGAPIEELNALRRHCERLKGGGLARLAWPARVEGLILSDVVGSPLHVIASGPLSPDPTGPADALAIIAGYGLARRMPPPVMAHLRRAAASPAARPAAEPQGRARATIIGDNEEAQAAAAAAAAAAGLAVIRLEEPVTGPAAAAGRALGRRMRELAASQPRPWALIGGGETVVRLDPAASSGGVPAQGGRNQELALAAAGELAGLERVALLALATDGGDGSSPAAGAVATGDTLRRARAAGLDPAAALARHASFAFWRALGDAIITGPTGTNVNDLAIGLAW